MTLCSGIDDDSVCLCHPDQMDPPVLLALITETCSNNIPAMKTYPRSSLRPGAERQGRYPADHLQGGHAGRAAGRGRRSRRAPGQQPEGHRPEPVNGGGHGRSGRADGLTDTGHADGKRRRPAAVPGHCDPAGRAVLG